MVTSKGTKGDKQLGAFLKIAVAGAALYLVFRVEMLAIAMRDITKTETE